MGMGIGNYLNVQSWQFDAPAREYALPLPVWRQPGRCPGQGWVFLYFFAVRISCGHCPGLNQSLFTNSNGRCIGGYFRGNSRLPTALSAGKHKGILLVFPLYRNSLCTRLSRTWPVGL